MVDSTWSSWIYPLVYVLVLLRVRGSTVNITYVESAVEKGAVCLDGSPPAYHLSPGFDSGVNNWLVHIEGGGWCNNVTTCLDRKNTRLGSSRQMEKQWNFSAILSNNESSNPDFYNWNTVMIRYCDGSSFTGDVESVDPATNLHYRGARIWHAVMEELLAKGMSKAENALLSGCSAGGLASILHCDRFRALFQEGAKVKCFSDAGYFINGVKAIYRLLKLVRDRERKDITGKEYIKAFYNDVVTTHGSENYLPSSCTSRLGPGMCFFPQYIAPLIETPLFLLNPAYDTWQPGRRVIRSSGSLCSSVSRANSKPNRLITSSTLHDTDVMRYNKNVSEAANKCLPIKSHNKYVIGNILVPQTADPNGTWSRCKGDIRQCSSTQLHILQDFRDEFLNALASLETSSSRGMFINSCYAHCQSEAQDIWFGADSPVLENTTIAKAVGNWFYDRTTFQKIDCPYPCDTSCHNSIYWP